MTEETQRPASFGALLASIAQDISALASVGVIVLGAWQIYHPAGLIVLGGFGLVAAWLNARKG